MTRAQVNKAGVIVPLLLSSAALVLVLANILTGVQPQRDEAASAHIFQLLIAGQLPFIALFAVSADWARRNHVLAIVTLQALAIAVALLPVWLAGY